MRIIIKDATDIFAVGNAIAQVIDDVAGRVHEELDGKVVEGVVLNVDTLVEFIIEGIEEPQAVTTDREINGKPEIFTVRPLIDDVGNIISTKNNEFETFRHLDMLMEAELPHLRIKSEYSTALYRMEDETSHGGIRETVWDMKDGNKLVQYHIKGIGLVAELLLEGKVDSDVPD